MTRLVSLAAAALALGLAACASTPQYVAARGPNAVGYSEQQIESNRWHVIYQAPSGGDPALLDDYALLRASDLTLQQGQDWFVVVSRSTDASGSYYSGPSVGVGVGGASWGHSSSTGVGIGMSFPLGGHHHTTATAARLEVRMGKGPKPEGAYDARETSQNLRNRLPPSR